MTAQPLSGAQKSHLRSLGQTLEASVFVGKEGISQAVLAEMNKALDARELVKVRLLAERDERARLCVELAEKTGATEAGAVGKTALFFRRQADETRRSIELPEAKKKTTD